MLNTWEWSAVTTIRVSSSLVILMALRTASSNCRTPYRAFFAILSWWPLSMWVSNHYNKMWEFVILPLFLFCSQEIYMKISQVIVTLFITLNFLTREFNLQSIIPKSTIMDLDLYTVLCITYVPCKTSYHFGYLIFYSYECLLTLVKINIQTWDWILRFLSSYVLQKGNNYINSK